MRSTSKIACLLMSVALLASCSDKDVKEKNKNKKPMAPATDSGSVGGDAGPTGALNTYTNSIVTDPARLFIQAILKVNNQPQNYTEAFTYKGTNASSIALAGSKDMAILALPLGEQDSTVLDGILFSNVWHESLLNKKVLRLLWDVYLYKDGVDPNNLKSSDIHLDSYSTFKPEAFQWQNKSDSTDIYMLRLGEVQLSGLKAKAAELESQENIAGQALTFWLSETEDENSPAVYFSIPIELQ